MNKLKMRSKDNITDNIEKIQELFPNAITESEDGVKIDFDVLKQELSNDIVEGSKERYQLTWPGKKEAILTANTPTTKTLRPIKEKSVNFNGTENIYIEGDNLEVLKILQESYLGKVKCIYIDPPYNTGNDFIYNDKFSSDKMQELINSGQVDEEGNRLVVNNESNGRYHSDWISMMYSRIKLTKNLLTEDGIIFVSIDDSELYNLKKICDEIFGDSNFIATLKWKKKKQPSFLSNVATIIEYVLVYSKKKTKIKKLSIETLSDGDKPIINSSNKFVERTFKKGMHVKYESNVIKAGEYKNKSMSISFLDDVEIRDGITLNDFRVVGKFRNTQDLIDDYCDKGLIFITKNLGMRRYLSSEEKNKGKSITDLLLDWGQNQDGSNELKKLFEIDNDTNIFDNPKPVLLIKNLIDSITDKNDIIMDFFSGSATTAHATMQLNANDNKCRKYIMVQLQESVTSNENSFEFCVKNNLDPNICSIGQERIRRAAKKIEIETNANIDYGFRVFKVDSSNMKEVYYRPNEFRQDNLSLFESNIKEDRNDEDLLTQVILDLGLTLDLKIEERTINNHKVYFVADNSLVACFGENVKFDVIEKLCEFKPLKLVLRDSSFESDQDKINVLEKVKILTSNTEVSVI